MRGIALSLCVMTSCAAQAQLLLSDETSSLLNQYLSAEQVAAVEQTLLAVEQSSLGPLAERDIQISRPERSVQADVALAEGGSGTADDPWVRAIEQNLATVEPPAELVLPEGHYCVGRLDLPDGIFLTAAPGARVVLLADPALVMGEEGRPAVVSLGTRSGIVGCEIDGSASSGAIAVLARPETEGAVVADCHIHHMPDGLGITGTGTEATIVGNLLERIGYSGIRSGSGWMIAHNTVRFAGIDRPTGGGDDGIIPSTRTTGSRILNNLVIAQRLPNGRHAMATQVSHENTFAGNLCVCIGRLRGAIVLSDGSDRNTVLGNVVIGVPDGITGDRSGMGIHLNGNGNRVRGNAVIGTDRGVSAQPTSTGNVVEGNYLQVAALALEIPGVTGDDPQNTLGENTIVGIGAGIDYAGDDELAIWGTQILQQHELPDLEAPPAPAGTQQFSPVELRGDHLLAIVCQAGVEAAVTLRQRQLGDLQNDLAWTLHQPDGSFMLAGRAGVGESTTISFTPEESGLYLVVASSGRSTFLVESADVPVGVVADRGVSLIHGPNRLGAAVRVGATQFEVTLSASEQEPARLTILDPDGEVAATGQTLTEPEARLTLQVPVGEQAGAWTLVTSAADRERFEDHALSLGEGLTPVLWLLPEVHNGGG